MDTRTRILELAKELLINHGFNGFSYAHISKPLKIRNAAVHYHFAGKVELGLHLLESCRRPVFPRLGLDENCKPRKAIVRYLEASCDPDDAFVDLEIIGAMAADFAGLPDLLRAASRTALTHHTKWLSGQLKAGRKRGQVKFAGKPREQAAKVLMTLQGGQLHARLNGDKNSLPQLAAHMTSDLLSS